MRKNKNLFLTLEWKPNRYGRNDEINMEREVKLENNWPWAQPRITMILK